MLQLIGADPAKAVIDRREPAFEQSTLQAQFLFRIEAAVGNTIRILIAQEADGEVIQRA